MINQKTINLIRRQYFQEKMAVELIAARRGYCVNTIYKYLKPEYETADEQTARRLDPKIAPYEEIIREWLTNDTRIYYKQRHSAKRVYERLRELFPTFNCSYKTVTRFYRKVVEEIYADAKSVDTYCPNPGEVEIGCTPIKYTSNRESKTAYILILLFPYSRAAYIQIIKERNTECILSALQRIYEKLGGTPPVQTFMPTTNIYKHYLQDVSDITDKLFLRFIMYYGFKDEFAVPSAELPSLRCGSVIKYLRERLIITMPKASDFAEYNARLLADCERLFERTLSDKKNCVIKDLHEADRKTLLPLPPEPLKIVSFHKQKSNQVCEIVVDKKHRYYLLPELKNRYVYVYLTEDTVSIHNLHNKYIQSFDRYYSEISGDVTDNNQLLYMLRFKPGALLNTKLAELFPDTLSTFLRSIENSKRRPYITAMYRICVESDLTTAIAAVTLAVEKKCKSADDIVKVYNEYGRK